MAFEALALRGRQAAEPRGEVGGGRLGREGEQVGLRFGEGLGCAAGLAFEGEGRAGVAGGDGQGELGGDGFHGFVLGWQPGQRAKASGRSRQTD